MTPPDDIVRIRHIRDAASKALFHARGRSRSDLDTDELLRLALTKLVEIVGEAAKQVTQPTREQFPSVPWSAAARMRDRLALAREPFTWGSRLDVGTDELRAQYIHALRSEDGHDMSALLEFSRS